jgi:monofunctional biosynthetic peptidoglycan transglycosylase
MKQPFSFLWQWLPRPGRLVRYFLLLLLILALIAAGGAAWVFSDLPDITPLKKSGTTLTIEVPDWQGKMHPFQVGPKNSDWAPLETIPAELKWAVIVAEDAGFYQHDGIDVQAIKEALKYDLKRKRFDRGASTITQQLAKNLFLSRDKSIVRKLRELVLALRMEEELTKGRILELYLNVVELGPLVYGVGAGARYHFNIPVQFLVPSESAFLAAMLPGPRVAYNPKTKPVKVRKRAAHLLDLLLVRKILTADEIADAIADLERLGGEPQLLVAPLAPIASDESGAEVDDAEREVDGQDADPSAAPMDGASVAAATSVDVVPAEQGAVDDVPPNVDADEGKENPERQ